MEDGLATQQGGVIGGFPDEGRGFFRAGGAVGEHGGVDGAEVGLGGIGIDCEGEQIAPVAIRHAVDAGGGGAEGDVEALAGKIGADGGGFAGGVEQIRPFASAAQVSPAMESATR